VSGDIGSRQVFLEVAMIKIRKLKFAYPGDKLVFDNLMGLLKPQEGDIEIFNKVCQEEKDFDDVRRRIGFLFQNPDHQLFCPTVAEDIAFGPLNLGKTHKDAREIVSRISKLLGLEKYIDRASYKLSWGEKLATVLAMEPEVLLLDEPTAGLDERSTHKVLDYLKHNGTSFIIASHDMNFLKTLTDKIYLLNGGKILY